MTKSVIVSWRQVLESKKGDLGLMNDASLFSGIYAANTTFTSVYLIS